LIRRATSHGGTCYANGISMSNGTIKWFNTTKGYGFIQPEDGTSDVFVHISDVQRAGITELKEGAKISYDVQRGQQGKVSACNLKLV
jgi:CspA family cold shock protein